MKMFVLSLQPMIPPNLNVLPFFSPLLCGMLRECLDAFRKSDLNRSPLVSILVRKNPSYRDSNSRVSEGYEVTSALPGRPANSGAY